MKKKTSLLVFIIAAVMVFSLWPQQVNAAENAARTATADNVTINNWHDAMHWMTVQRMWGVYGRTSLYRQVM